MGILLFLMLTGKIPFTGKNEKDLYNNISNVNFSVDINKYKHLSEDSKDILLKMLTKNKNKRPTSEQLLNHDWFKNIQNFSLNLSKKKNN